MPTMRPAKGFDFSTSLERPHRRHGGRTRRCRGWSALRPARLWADAGWLARPQAVAVTRTRCGTRCGEASAGHDGV
jgi:hypothetical protein